MFWIFHFFVFFLFYFWFYGYRYMYMFINLFPLVFFSFLGTCRNENRCWYCWITLGKRESVEYKLERGDKRSVGGYWKKEYTIDFFFFFGHCICHTLPRRNKQHLSIYITFLIFLKKYYSYDYHLFFSFDIYLDT